MSENVLCLLFEMLFKAVFLKHLNRRLNREIKGCYEEAIFSFLATIMAFLHCVGLQDIKSQCWTDEESDGENESEQFLYGIQVEKALLLLK